MPMNRPTRTGGRGRGGQRDYLERQAGEHVFSTCNYIGGFETARSKNYRSAVLSHIATCSRISLKHSSSAAADRWLVTMMRA